MKKNKKALLTFLVACCLNCGYLSAIAQAADMTVDVGIEFVEGSTTQSEVTPPSKLPNTQTPNKVIQLPRTNEKEGNFVSVVTGILLLVVWGCISTGRKERR